jgi:hypothetical protein
MPLPEYIPRISRVLNDKKHSRNGAIPDGMNKSMSPTINGCEDSAIIA